VVYFNILPQNMLERLWGLQSHLFNMFGRIFYRCEDSYTFLWFVAKHMNRHTDNMSGVKAYYT